MTATIMTVMHLLAQMPTATRRNRPGRPGRLSSASPARLPQESTGPGGFGSGRRGGCRCSRGAGPGDVSV